MAPDCQVCQLKEAERRHGKRRRSLRVMSEVRVVCRALLDPTTGASTDVCCNVDEGVSVRHSARASKEAELGVSSEGGVTPPKLQSLGYKSGIKEEGCGSR